MTAGGLGLRRAVAAVVDVGIGAALALVLSYTAVGWFFAERAVVMLRIGAPDTVWRGPIPMMMGILGTFVYGIPFAVLLVLLAEPIVGVSPGKALLGLTIASGDGSAPTIGRRWRRAIVRDAPWWGMVLALLTGSWQLALVSVLVAIVLAARTTVSLFTAAPSLHDRLSGTSVTPTG